MHKSLQNGHNKNSPINNPRTVPLPANNDTKEEGRRIERGKEDREGEGIGRGKGWGGGRNREGMGRE